MGDILSDDPQDPPPLEWPLLDNLEGLTPYGSYLRLSKGREGRLFTLEDLSRFVRLTNAELDSRVNVEWPYGVLKIYSNPMYDRGMARIEYQQRGRHFRRGDLADLGAEAVRAEVQGLLALAVDVTGKAFALGAEELRKVLTAVGVLISALRRVKAAPGQDPFGGRSGTWPGLSCRTLRPWATVALGASSRCRAPSDRRVGLSLTHTPFDPSPQRVMFATTL